MDTENSNNFSAASTNQGRFLNLISMSEFPAKVLTRIFYFLDNIHDRNSSRLVCHRWYDVLNTRTFTDKEVIVIRGNRFKKEETCVEKIMSIFAKSKRISINLELVRLTLSQESTSFQICSPRISSLALLHCKCDPTYSGENIITILKSCNNLEEFIITYEKSFTSAVFRDMVSNNFTCSNSLTILKLLSRHYDYIPTSALYKMPFLFKDAIQVFPHLSHIEIGLCLICDNLEFGGSNLELSLSQMMNAPVANETLSHDQVRSLKYCLVDTMMEPSTALLSLNKISGNETVSSAKKIMFTEVVLRNDIIGSAESVIKSLKNYCDLRYLKFRILSEIPENDDGKNQSLDLQVILKSCPNIRSLDIVTQRNYDWTMELDDDVANSRIEKVSIEARSLQCSANILQSKNVLTTLKVSFSSPDIENCTNLRKLIIGTVNFAYFRILCNSMTSLEELIVGFLDCSDSGINPNESTALNNLKNLRVLKLPMGLVLNPEGISLPQLRKLCITFSIKEKPNLLSFLIGKCNCPLLQNLCIDCDARNTYYKYNWLIDFIVPLKNLRVLGLQPRSWGPNKTVIPFTDDEVTTIFQKCLRLRTLHAWTYLYYYDPLTEKVKFSDPEVDHRPHFPLSYAVGETVRIKDGDDTDDENEDVTRDYGDHYDSCGDFLSSVFD